MVVLRKFVMIRWVHKSGFCSDASRMKCLTDGIFIRKSEEMSQHPRRHVKLIWAEMLALILLAFVGR